MRRGAHEAPRRRCATRNVTIAVVVGLVASFGGTAHAHWSTSSDVSVAGTNGFVAVDSGDLAPFELVCEAVRFPDRALSFVRLWAPETEPALPVEARGEGTFKIEDDLIGEAPLEVDLGSVSVMITEWVSAPDESEFVGFSYLVAGDGEVTVDVMASTSIWRTSISGTGTWAFEDEPVVPGNKPIGSVELVRCDPETVSMPWQIANEGSIPGVVFARITGLEPEACGTFGVAVGTAPPMPLCDSTGPWIPLGLGIDPGAGEVVDIVVAVDTWFPASTPTPVTGALQAMLVQWNADPPLAPGWWSDVGVTEFQVMFLITPPAPIAAAQPAAPSESTDTVATTTTIERSGQSEDPVADDSEPAADPVAVPEPSSTDDPADGALPEDAFEPDLDGSDTEGTSGTGPAVEAPVTSPDDPTATGSSEGSISGHVWLDADADGLAVFLAEGADEGTADEPLHAVGVALLDADGRRIRQASTDAAGAYRFDGLAPGTYSIEVDLPKTLGWFGDADREVETAAAALADTLGIDVASVVTDDTAEVDAHRSGWRLRSGPIHVDGNAESGSSDFAAQELPKPGNRHGKDPNAAAYRSDEEPVPEPAVGGGPAPGSDRSSNSQRRGDPSSAIDGATTTKEQAP